MKVERNAPPYQSARFGAVFDLGKTCLRTALWRGSVLGVVIGPRSMNEG